MNTLSVKLSLSLITLLLSFVWLPGFVFAENELVTLDNGLQVIVKENHTAPVAALRIYVKTGSIHEQEFLGMGISHLFEHLISGGTTKNRSEKEINKLIERLGNANNAYTTKGHTCYYINTTAAQIGEAIDLFADWMMNSTFPKNEYQREMGVVMEELKKGQSEPNRILYKALSETIFTVHPAKYPVIGYENLVKKIRHEDILTYYKRMYAPNNMIVVVVGDFDRKTVLDRIKEAFSPFQRRVLPAVSLPSEPMQMGIRIRAVEHPGLRLGYLALAFRTVPIDHKDLYALDVMSYILSKGGSSRLVKRIREDKGLVSSIYSSSYTPEYDAGVFSVVSTGRPENNQKAKEAILKELYLLQQDLVTPEELKKAKRQKIASDILSRQTAADEASDLGINLLMTGNLDFGKVYLEGIKKVSATDIRQVARRYIRDDNLSILSIVPQGFKRKMTAIKEEKVKSSTIRKLILPNGMTILLKRNPNLPLVNIQGWFYGGVRLEPVGEAGISLLMAKILTRGTKTHSRDDIAKIFDQMGGKFSANSGNNTVSLSVEILKENLDQALELFANSIKHPTFPEEELTILKRNTLTAIQGRMDDWSNELDYLFRQHFFTKHPYRNDSLGTEKTVQAITRDKLQQFYQDHIIPSRSVITVFGDIDEEDVIKKLRKLFSDFNPKGAKLPVIPAEPPLAVNKNIAKMVKKNIAALFIGFPGVTTHDVKNRYPLIVLDAVLSGIGYPGGRLHEALRGGDKDLVYLVHAFNFTGFEPGYFGIKAASTPAKMDTVIQVILKEIASIREEKVSDKELEKAKLMCITMDTLSRQTNSLMALEAGLDELYGLGYDDYTHYAKRIRAVTGEDLRRVAQKYLKNYVMIRTVPEVPQNQ